MDCFIKIVYYILKAGQNHYSYSLTCKNDYKFSIKV